MTPLHERFYKHVKSQRCLVCGKFGVDVAHIRPLSRHVNVDGRRDWTARSHNGTLGFFAIPLCREHHNMVHKHGEGWLHEKVGADVVYATALRLLADTCMGEWHGA